MAMSEIVKKGAKSTMEWLKSASMEKLVSSYYHCSWLMNKFRTSGVPEEMVQFSEQVVEARVKELGNRFAMLKKGAIKRIEKEEMDSGFDDRIQDLEKESSLEDVK